MTRYPPIPPEDMYFEQRRVAQAVAQRRKGGLSGPFVPLLHVPGVLDRFQTLGEHLRFDTGLPRKLLELAILITARHVQAPYEFHVHSRPAREFGISDDTIAALAANRRPSKLDDDEVLIYDFCTELHRTGRVSDQMFARANARFGKAVILDVIATCGYYGGLGWVLNVTQTLPPPEVVPPFTVVAD